MNKRRQERQKKEERKRNNCIKLKKGLNFFLVYCIYIYIMSLDGIPLAMQWEIKRLKVLQKETVTMTPNKTQDVKPGQTIIVDLPYNSKIDYGFTTVVQIFHMVLRR